MALTTTEKRPPLSAKRNHVTDAGSYPMAKDTTDAPPVHSTTPSADAPPDTFNEVLMPAEWGKGNCATCRNQAVFADTMQTCPHCGSDMLTMRPLAKGTPEYEIAWAAHLDSLEKMRAEPKAQRSTPGDADPAAAELPTPHPYSAAELGVPLSDPAELAAVLTYRQAREVLIGRVRQYGEPVTFAPGVTWCALLLGEARNSTAVVQLLGIEGGRLAVVAHYACPAEMATGEATRDAGAIFFTADDTDHVIADAFILTEEVACLWPGPAQETARALFVSALTAAVETAPELGGLFMRNHPHETDTLWNHPARI